MSEKSDKPARNASRSDAGRVKKLVREGELEFTKTITAMLSSAFALVAALAWDEFVKELISRYISPGLGLRSRLIYALIVTFLAALVIWQLGKIVARLTQEKEEKDG